MMSFGELYLRNPDVFPDFQSGETWGDNSLVIDFVGGPYLFHGLDAILQKQLGGWFEDFAAPITADQPQQGIEARFFRAPPSDFLDFHSADHDKPTLDMKFEQNAILIAGWKFMARIELHPVLKGAIWISCEGTYLDKLAIMSFFRIVAAYRLHLMGGMMLHSAAIVKNGGGYVFIGESGAGKTTLSLAGIEAGLEVLSDDLNAIIPQGEELIVKKVPFAGTLDRETSALTEVPLRMIGALHKGVANRINYGCYSRAQAVALLMAQVPFVNSDPFQFEQLQSNIDKFLQLAPLASATVMLGGDPNELFHMKLQTSQTDLDKSYAYY